MSTLTRAIQIATEAHDGQTDKGGAPYILHPLRVMLAMETEEERIVAVLHDVLEDCDGWTLERLDGERFSWRTLYALEALTRRSGETYSAFIGRVSIDPIATRVKMADLRDNMDLSRIQNPKDVDYRRTEKYHVHLAELRRLSPDPTPTNDKTASPR